MVEGEPDDEPVEKPKSMATPSLVVCERSVELPNEALSLMAMTTVTMSPTLAMRWSV